MNESHEALSLVVFYLGAFLAPLLAARLGMPSAVVEILFGLLVGTSGLHLVHPAPFTTFLAQFGFIFLMFLVGLEIDFNQIRKEGRWVALATGIIAAGILGLGIALARVLGFPAFTGLVMGAMSCGILLVALNETRTTKTRLGQLLLMVGSIGEFLTLFVLTGFNLVSRFGVSQQLVIEGGRALMLFVVALLLLSLMRLLVWWAPHRFQRLVHAQDPSEVGVRAGFVLMLVLSTLATQVGLEAILGSFSAGTLFSFVFRKKGVLDAKLAAIGQGFFVPLFFINVGVGFNASALSDPLGVARTVGLLAGASLLCKGTPLLLLRALGIPFRQIAASGFLLASPLTLLVAVAAIGNTLKIFDERMTAAVILLGILGGVTFPVVFKRLLGAVDDPKPAQAQKL